MPLFLFNLFQVNFDAETSNYKTLEEAFKTETKLVLQVARNGNKFELEGKILKRSGYYYGTFCLIQSTNLPPLKKPGEASRPIQSEDEDEGLGHYTLFIYDPALRMIAIQKNINGVTPNGIADFFKRSYGLRNLELSIVINPATLAQLQKLTVIRSLEISVAKVENGTFLKGTDKSFGDVNSLADDTNANTMVLKLGMGYERKGGLKKNKIIQLIQRLLNAKKEEVRKISISGAEEEDDTYTDYDFINNKVVLSVNLPKSRHFSGNSINQLLQEAIHQYNKIRPDITSVYKVKSNNLGN